MLWVALLSACLYTAQADTQAGKQTNRNYLRPGFKLCGCSWNEREGCTVSSSQMLKAVQNTSMTELCDKTGGKGNMTEEEKKQLHDPEDAKDRAANECKIRREIAEIAPFMEKCVTFKENAECSGVNAEKHYCEWGAQEAEKCGIDKEKLMEKLVGSDGQKTALMKLVAQADNCQALSKQNCDTDSDCHWEKSEDLCQIGRKFFWVNILEHPEILGLLFIINDGSICRADAEHGSGSCTSNYCQSEGGFCTVDHRQTTKLPTSSEKLADILCERNYDIKKNGSSEEDACYRPCAMVTPSSFDRDVTDGEGDKDKNKKVCRVQNDHSHEVRATKLDIAVAQVYMIVHSAWVPYERHCNMMDGNETACKQCLEECEGALGDKWTLHGPDAGEDPAPGLSGYIGKVAQAVIENGVEMRFKEFLDENPQQIEVLLKAYKDGISHIWPGDETGHGGRDKEETKKPHKDPVPSDMFADPWSSAKNPTHFLLFLSGLLLLATIFAWFKYGVPNNLPCFPKNPATDPMLSESGSDMEG